MKPKITKKLMLSRETVRALQDSELRLVAGGQVNRGFVVSGGGCTHCVCWSTSSTTAALGLADVQLAGVQAAL